MNDRVGAVFTWSNVTEIKSRVGISFMSVDKACAYKTTELSSWSIEDAAQATRDEWNRDVFSKIRVDTSETANKTRLALLYSSLYFMHLIPSERVGENPLWDSDEPYWDDFYTLWVRTTMYELHVRHTLTSYIDILGSLPKPSLAMASHPAELLRVYDPISH
jgi:putative alpha-1,2-mannosidase